MELKDTITAMLSSNYKDRLKAEYTQLKIRRDKLQALLNQYKDGKLSFQPNTPYDKLHEQLVFMNSYLGVLQSRAYDEEVNLDSVKFGESDSITCGKVNLDIIPFEYTDFDEPLFEFNTIDWVESIQEHLNDFIRSSEYNNDEKSSRFDSAIEMVWIIAWAMSYLKSLNYSPEELKKVVDSVNQVASEMR